MESIAPHSIMIIGTDLHFCYLMRRYVRESDHPLLSATPDNQAIKIAQREKPALIIMEVGDSTARSDEMVQLLKRNQDTCKIPIVFCSWHDEEISVTQPGADICLRMPVLYSDFLSTLNTLGI